jgi:hypothetical protein
MNQDNEQENEKPLDPATERVRVKLVRFSAVFMGLNIIALMAVLGAIVYKIGGYGAEGAGEEAASSASLPGAAGAVADLPLDMSIKLPAESQVIAASVQGGRVSVTMRLATGERQLRVYNVSDGSQVALIRFE